MVYFIVILFHCICFLLCFCYINIFNSEFSTPSFCFVCLFFTLFLEINHFYKDTKNFVYFYLNSLRSDFERVFQFLFILFLLKICAKYSDHSFPYPHFLPDPLHLPTHQITISFSISLENKESTKNQSKQSRIEKTAKEHKKHKHTHIP